MTIPSEPLGETGFTAHVLRTRETLVVNENMPEVMARTIRAALADDEPFAFGFEVLCQRGEGAAEEFLPRRSAPRTTAIAARSRCGRGSTRRRPPTAT